MLLLNRALYKHYAIRLKSDVIRGDANSDGDFTIADLVMLQNYLVRSREVTAWSAGDLCEDMPLSYCLTYRV